jgi:hypothetical protein
MSGCSRSSEKRLYHAGKDSFNDPLDGINAYKLEFTTQDIDTFFQNLAVNEPDPVLRAKTTSAVG